MAESLYSIFFLPSPFISFLGIFVHIMQSKATHTNTDCGRLFPVAHELEESAALQFAKGQAPPQAVCIEVNGTVE